MKIFFKFSYRYSFYILYLNNDCTSLHPLPSSWGPHFISITLGIRERPLSLGHSRKLAGGVITTPGEVSRPCVTLESFVLRFVIFFVSIQLKNGLDLSTDRHTEECSFVGLWDFYKLNSFWKILKLFPGKVKKVNCFTLLLSVRWVNDGFSLCVCVQLNF